MGKKIVEGDSRETGKPRDFDLYVLDKDHEFSYKIQALKADKVARITRTSPAVTYIWIGNRVPKNEHQRALRYPESFDKEKVKVKGSELVIVEQGKEPGDLAPVIKEALKRGQDSFLSRRKKIAALCAGGCIGALAGLLAGDAPVLVAGNAFITAVLLLLISFDLRWREEWGKYIWRHMILITGVMTGLGALAGGLGPSGIAAGAGLGFKMGFVLALEWGLTMREMDSTFTFVFYIFFMGLGGLVGLFVGLSTMGGSASGAFAGIFGGTLCGIGIAWFIFTIIFNCLKPTFLLPAITIAGLIIGAILQPADYFFPAFNVSLIIGSTAFVAWCLYLMFTRRFSDYQ
nr:hypothetical protein [Candidatus Sigynarchaeota archaeon]